MQIYIKYHHMYANALDLWSLQISLLVRNDHRSSIDLHKTFGFNTILLSKQSKNSIYQLWNCYDKGSVATATPPLVHNVNIKCYVGHFNQCFAYKVLHLNAKLIETNIQCKYRKFRGSRQLPRRLCKYKRI